MAYFIYFFIYSFIGFILETLYTLLTSGVFIWKKCLLINFLCPVYGIGAIAILFSTRKMRAYKLLSMLVGGITATIIEYLYHFFYSDFLGVTLWDYTDSALNFNGRICLTFTLFWIILSGILIYIVHPYIEKNMTSIPKTMSIIIVLFIGIDAIISALLYNEFGCKEAVNINWLVNNFHHMLG